MAKVIWHGMAKPDDPIYKGGAVIGGKRFYNTSKTDKKRKPPPKPKEKK
jgi:hypothetical protein